MTRLLIHLEKQRGSTHQQRQLTTGCVDAVFHRNFSLLEQTNIYYHQQLDREAGPSRRIPDITLPDIMTFTGLALQMEHIAKDTLHDYWSRLKQMHTVLRRHYDTRQIFTLFALSGQFTETQPSGDYDRL